MAVDTAEVILKYFDINSCHLFNHFESKNIKHWF